MVVTLRFGRNKLSPIFRAFSLLMLLMAINSPSLWATEAEDAAAAQRIEADAAASGGGGAAASNPISAVNNTDLKWTHIKIDDPNDSRTNDYWIRGGWTPKRWLKLSYELTYRETDISGTSQSDWESVSLKPIFFLNQGEIGSWKYRMATGFEWIVDFDNFKEGSDQLGPLFGIALTPQPGTILVPLVQHFASYNGPTVSTTGFRLIGIQSLPYDAWTKLDFIVPYDWENEIWPATAEVELGKMFTNFFGLYIIGLAGIGGDAFMDWGASLNLRFVY